MAGSAVIADGLEGLCEKILSTKRIGKWSHQRDTGIATSLRVQEANPEMIETGRALARIFGYTLHSAFFQECFSGYSIEEHSHIGSLPGYSDVVYGLLYTSSEGKSILTLKDPDIGVERRRGRLVLVPEDRKHAVYSSDGHNTMIRFVFVPRQPGDRDPACKELIKEIRPEMQISYV